MIAKYVFFIAELTASLLYTFVADKEEFDCHMFYVLWNWTSYSSIYIHERTSYLNKTNIRKQIIQAMESKIPLL